MHKIGKMTCVLWGLKPSDKGQISKLYPTLSEGKVRRSKPHINTRETASLGGAKNVRKYSICTRVPPPRYGLVTYV